MSLSVDYYYRTVVLQYFYNIEEGVELHQGPIYEIAAAGATTEVASSQLI